MLLFTNSYRINVTELSLPSSESPGWTKVLTKRNATHTKWRNVPPTFILAMITQNILHNLTQEIVKYYCHLWPLWSHPCLRCYIVKLLDKLHGNVLDNTYPEWSVQWMIVTNLSLWLVRKLHSSPLYVPIV